MAFSAKFGAAKPKVDDPSAPQEAAGGGGGGQQEEIERRRAQEREAEARRRQGVFETRRRAAEEEQRRNEYEAEKARQSTIARSKKEAARRAMGPTGNQNVFGAGGGGGSFAWKKPTVSAAGGEGGKGGGKAADPRFANLPSHDQCELGIQAMVSRTPAGMKEGLQHLGLPNYPLHFIPGQEFRLCGHNLREEINAMIHGWMTNEKDEFFNWLVQIREICEKPLLTREEVEMMSSIDMWEETAQRSPIGEVLYARRDPSKPAPASAPAAAKPADDDDDDDEIIDVTPSGARLPPSSGGIAQDSAAGRSFAGPARDRPANPPPPPEDDYYELLGVSSGASLFDIRAKFRSLVITEHPEKGGDIEKFQKLNKAYSVLSDQKKRQEFDAARAASGRGGGGKGSGGYPGTAPTKTFVD